MMVRGPVLFFSTDDQPDPNPLAADRRRLSIAQRETARFRTESRRATPEAIEAARKQHDLEFKSVAEDLGAIVRATAQSITDEDLRRWTLHPDELVPLTLARIHHSQHTLPMLIARATGDADAEDVLWTPLLDMRRWSVCFSRSCPASDLRRSRACSPLRS